MIFLETALIILEQSLLHLPLLFGAYISISLIKTPDLSLESAYVFGALVGGTVLTMTSALPCGLALVIIIFCSLMGGACVGMISSMLTRFIHISHLLATIITVGIFHGFNQLVAGSYLSLSSYQNLLTCELIPLHPEIPVLSVIALIVIILSLLFFRSQLGYSCAVFGYNPAFFSHYGISPSFIFIVGVVVANALAGLSGFLIAQSNGFAEITMGFGKVLLCITALIVGRVIYHRTLSIITPLCGIMLYFTIQQLLLKVGFDLRYFTMVQALVVLAVFVTQYSKNKSMHVNQLGV